MKKIFQEKRNRIFVYCFSVICMTFLFLSKNASAFPFVHVWDNGTEKTFELYAQQKSEQYVTSDFATAMSASGKDFTAEMEADVSSDTEADHILRIYCGFFPLMFATCEIGNPSLGVYVISNQGRVLQKF